MFKIDCTLEFSAEEYNKKTGKPLLLALMLDEMSLKKEIISEKNTQNVWDYVDFGANIPNSDSQEIATEVLVLMVVGVNMNFKFPVGYFFINKLTGPEKDNIVKQALHYLNISPNFKIISLTCDGLYANFKMMTELGYRTDNRIG